MGENGRQDEAEVHRIQVNGTADSDGPPDEADTEGHRFRRSIIGDDDTEGHRWRSKNATEGGDTPTSDEADSEDGAQ